MSRSRTPWAISKAECWFMNMTQIFLWFLAKVSQVSSRVTTSLISKIFWGSYRRERLCGIEGYAFFGVGLEALEQAGDEGGPDHFELDGFGVGDLHALAEVGGLAQEVVVLFN